MSVLLSRWPIAPLIRRSGPLPAPSRQVLIFDVLLAVLVTAYALFYAVNTRFLSPPGYFPPGVALTVLSSAPLVVRRRYPLACFVIVLAATVLMHGSATPRIALLTSLIAAYSAAMYSPYRVPTRLGLLLAAVLVSTYFSTALPDIPSGLTSFAVLVPIGLAAETIRTARARAEDSRRRVVAMAGEQEEKTRHAIEQERSRIARELHDVVTHNVSVMVVQAGAARKIMASAPEKATDALLAVEASGRTAMAELRQVMGLLSPSDTDQDGELAPQPGLDQLPALVERVRGTGIDVDYTVTGTPRPLPQGVDLAAYRVVQEALTNTVKHAVGASARVCVEFDADTVQLTVTDDGGQAGATAATGNGRGLLGLRERLAVYQGSLDAGPHRGGFRVYARIPA
ncbi:MAG TPA: histidine kinase [Pseudonocardiaceae bacterium]|nr:histidine kinase [Pseudonocardiaceae bacterium]